MKTQLARFTVFLPMLVLFLGAAFAQEPSYSNPQLLRETNVTIPVDYTPFGNRIQFNRFGDDGSSCLLDASGILTWIDKTGAVRLLPNTSLATPLLVTNTECLVWVNRFVDHDTYPARPNVELALFRAPLGSTTVTSANVNVNGKEIVTTPVTTTSTNPLTIITTERRDNGAELNINFQFDDCIIRMYRLTFDGSVQLLNSIPTFLIRGSLPYANTTTGPETEVLGIGSDGSALIQTSCQHVGAPAITAIPIFRTHWIDSQGRDVALDTPLDPLGLVGNLVQRGVFCSNTRVVIQDNQVPTGIFDFRRSPQTGLLLPGSPTQIAGIVGGIMDFTNESKFGETKFFYTNQQNAPAVGQSTVRIYQLGDASATLVQTAVLPSLVSNFASTVIINPLDGSAILRSEDGVSMFWLHAGGNGFTPVPNSNKASPIFVTTEQAVIWDNAFAPTLGDGSIPEASITHYQRAAAAPNNAALTTTTIIVEGFSLLNTNRFTPEFEFWQLTTSQKINANTVVLRTYQLLNALLKDTDNDGIPDIHETNTGIYVSRTNTGSDPTDADTDGDGRPDGEEVYPFFVVEGNFTWDEAKANAETLGGYLATINSVVEFDGFERRMQRLAVQYELWLGASDTVVEGSFRWVTGELWGGFTNWAPGEPNNLLNSDGLYRRTSDKWGDARIDTTRSYALEYIASDPTDPDTDDDGLNDAEEIAFGSDPTKADTDGDGLTDKEEFDLGTNPLLTDTDGDGLSDFEEVFTHRTDPTNEDTDNDGLDDGEEVARGTNPRKRDTDKDGLFDGDEVSLGTDPLEPDTDGDGLKDGREVDLGTDPLKPDTDGDGIKDGDEVENGTDPLDRRDPKRLDSDGDGLSNYEEIYIYGTDPDKQDTDGDGLNDRVEIEKYGTDPLRKDTDRDGISDGDEVNVTFTDPNRPSTGGSGSGTNIPFRNASVQGVYEGLVVSKSGGQTFKQTMIISGGGGFTSRLDGLRSTTSFKGKFSSTGLFTGKPENTEDLKSARIQVVMEGNNKYSVQGKFESRKSGTYYFELRKVNSSAKSAVNRNVTLDTKTGSGKGPKGSIIGLGTLRDKSSARLNFYLPDGGRSSFSGSVLNGNLIALFAKTGDWSGAVIMGMLKVRDVKNSSDFDGPVRFHSGGSGNGSFYPSGYDQQRTIRGGYYRNPSPGTLPISDFKVGSNNAVFQWNGGDFGGVKKAATWTTDGKMIIPTNQNDSARYSFDKRTGLLKMTYVRTDSALELVGATSQVVAIVQQKQDSFRGYYISDGSAAGFNVAPNKNGVKPDVATISPRSITVPAAGGTYTVTVRTEGQWSVNIPTNIIDISGIQVTGIINSNGQSGTPDKVKGNGNGTVTFTVAPNAGLARMTADITIAGIKHELTQDFR